MRRAALAVIVAATAVATVLPTQAAAALPGPSNAQRAAATWTALQQYLAVHDGSGLYHEQYPVQSTDNPYSYEWPFSQAHVAALDLSGMSGRAGRSHRDVLQRADYAQLHYWDTAGSTGLPGFASYVMAPYGSGGDFFYDDNEWVGLQDVQHYALYRDQSSLRQARKIFDLVVSGWDTDPSHADPGGVFWTQATWSSDRNTVSNMPGAELGLRLYQITGQRRYLNWALKMYHWTNTYLQRPDGLYKDHLGLDGTVEPTVWSYNQGVPVGVNVLLYEVTGDFAYVQEAKRIATAALGYFGAHHRLIKQPPYFNSIFFANLLLLQSVSPGSRYLNAMRAYANAAWASRRDPSTGLFHFSSETETQTLEQAAMTQIYALLAWPRSRYGQLY
jgi:hypothetical protein